MTPKYRRMVTGLASRKRKKREPADWNVYIVRCEGGSFYTGTAKDVPGRVARHNKGQGAAYTRSRRPVVLLYQENGMTRSQALVREARIKALSRKEKEGLVGR